MDAEPSRHGQHQGCQGGGCSGLELQAALLLAGLQGATLCLQERGGTCTQPAEGQIPCVHTYLWGGWQHTQAGTHPERENKRLRKNQQGTQ